MDLILLIRNWGRYMKGLLPTVTSKCECLTKIRAPLPKKTKLGTKTVNYIFIGYVLNNGAYIFLIHKSEIPDIHVNIIIKSRDDVFLEDVFSYKLEEYKTSEKRTHETVFRDEGPSEPTIDTKVELISSKRSRISKSFGLNFVAYTLETESQIFKEVTSTLKAQI